MKLLQKRTVVVNQAQAYYVACFLAFVIMTGVIFFMGGDLLLTIFALTVAGVFLVLGAPSPQFALQRYRRGTRTVADDGLRAHAARSPQWACTWRPRASR